MDSTTGDAQTVRTTTGGFRNARCTDPSHDDPGIHGKRLTTDQPIQQSIAPGESAERRTNDGFHDRRCTNRAHDDPGIHGKRLTTD